MRTLGPGAGMIVVAILVDACGGSASATAAPSVASQLSESGLSTPAIAAEPTERPLGSYEACDAGAPGAITLTVRDQEAEDGIGPVIDQLNREFEAANTSVDVVRQNETRGDLANSILGALTTAQGPDITQLEPGRAGVGEAVKAGLLLPLTDASTRYGWGDRWAPRTLDRMRFADDGTGFGSGTLYGVPVTGELVGLMFNDEAGHAKRPAGPVPQTLDEDMEDYALIKGAGWTPILVGAADGEMLHVYGSILGSLVTPESLDSFVYGRDGGSFDTEAAVKAAGMLLAMRDRGFFADGYASMTSEEAYGRFVSGEAQFLATGSWAWPALKATGRSFTLVTWEPETAGGIALSPGGTGLPWAVRKTSANPGCAVAYLDYITSDHAMEVIAAQELALPSHVSPGALGQDPWFKDMTFAYRDTESANQLGHYLDSAFPTGPETFNTNLARLLADKITPGQFVQNIDSEYQAYLATLR